MPTSAIEVEQRYSLKSLHQINQKLQSLHIPLYQQSHIIDHWFLPTTITSRQEHDQWYDQDRGCAIRIREELDTSNYPIQTYLETKRLTATLNHREIEESSMAIPSYQEAMPLLAALDRYEFLTINKTRQTYLHHNITIALDTITNFGCGIELEIQTDQPDKAVTELTSFAHQLGLHPTQKLDKSLTVQAMQNLAHFQK